MNSYNINSVNFYVENNGEIEGILPLGIMRSRIFSNRLISLPFANYGGICAETRQVGDILLSAAKIVLLRGKFNYLELRQTDKLINSELANKEQYSTSILKLMGDENEIIDPDILSAAQQNDATLCL